MFQSHLSPSAFKDWVEGKTTLGHPKRLANTLDSFVRINTEGPICIAVPVELYSSERTILASMQYLSLEVRSHASFMSLQLDVAPVSFSIPSVRDDRELETPIARSLRLDSSANLELDGFSMGLHLLYGPEPQRQTYREQYSLFAGNVSGQCVAGQVLTVVTTIKNFLHHLYSWEDELFSDITPYTQEMRRDKQRALTEIDVHITGVDLAVVMMDTLIQLSCPDGARIHFDTRKTPLNTDVIHIAVSPLQLVQYLPLTTGHLGFFTDQDDWTDVANIQLSADIRLVSKRDTWLAEMREQTAYIAANDAATGRCAVLLSQVDQQLAHHLAMALAERESHKTTRKASAPPLGRNLRVRGFSGTGAQGHVSTPHMAHPRPPLSPTSAAAAAAAAASSAQASKGSPDPEAVASAEHKRCGRLYRASLPSAEAPSSKQPYVSEPLVFRPMYAEEDTDSAKPQTRHRKESNFRRHGSISMAASVDPLLSQSGGGSRGGPSNNVAGPSASASQGAGKKSVALPNLRVLDALEPSSFGSSGVDPLHSSSSALLAASIANHIRELELLTYGHLNSLALRRDQETTNVFIRASDPAVISISPNTLSSLHKWLETMALQLPHVEAVWDSLQWRVTRTHFFAPKHALQTIQVSVKLPPVRLELYSSLGENLNAALVISGVDMAVHLDEQMNISAETPPPLDQAIGRRGLTSFVKDDVVAKSGESGGTGMESVVFGGASNAIKNDNTISSLGASLKLPDHAENNNNNNNERASPRSAAGGEGTYIPIIDDIADGVQSVGLRVTQLTGKAMGRLSVEPQGSDRVPQERRGSIRRVARRGSVAPARASGDRRDFGSPRAVPPLKKYGRRSDGTRLHVPGKSFLRKASVSASVASLSFAVFESAEPAPSPVPVLLVNLSNATGTMLLETHESGRKGTGQLKLARVDAKSHSLLAQNIPELLVNWAFPVKVIEREREPHTHMYVSITHQKP